MLSSFEVGVDVKLFDHVTGAMAGITRSLMGGHTAASKFEDKLSKIASKFAGGALMFGAGMALAEPLWKAVEAGDEYLHKLNQMKSAGFTQIEMAGAIGTAWKTTSDIITSSATENLEIITDLRSVFGSMSEALEYTPKFSKIQGAYAGILDGKLAGQAKEQSFAMAKALDMEGKVKDRKVFDKAADSMFRVTEATTGRVLPSDYQAVDKYARQAKYGLSDDFRYKVMPELILENKTGKSGGASGVGTQLAAFYTTAIQGIMKKEMATKLADMGMFDKRALSTKVSKEDKENSKLFLKTTTNDTTLKAPMLGADIAAQNPLKWVNEVYLPKLAKKYNLSLDDKDGLVNANNQVFKGNRLATSLIGELIKKPYQYERFGKLYEKTKSPDQAYEQGMKNDPNMNWKALGAAFENLKTSIGMHVVPVIIPAITSLATGIGTAATFLKDHPGITKAVVGVTALAAGALVLAGTLAMGGAVIGGISTLGTALGTLVGPLAIGAAATVTALGVAIANWDTIVKTAKGGFDNLKTAFGLLLAICPPLKSGVTNIVGAFKILKNLMGEGASAANLFKVSIAGLIDLMRGKLPFGLDYLAHPPKPAEPKKTDAWGVGWNLLNAVAQRQLSDVGLSSVPSRAASTVHPSSANIPSKHAGVSVSQQTVAITQNNTTHVHAAPGHDVHHIAREVTRLQTLNNHHLTKAIPSGQGSYRSNFSQGDTRGNE